MKIKIITNFFTNSLIESNDARSNFRTRTLTLPARRKISFRAFSPLTSDRHAMYTLAPLQ